MITIHNISAKEFLDERAKNADDMEVVDVRGAWEYDLAKLPGAVKYLPLPQIVANRQGVADAINWNKHVVFVCRTGGRSKQAALLLANFAKGDAAYNLSGGLKAIFAERLDVLEGDQNKMEHYFF